MNKLDCFLSVLIYIFNACNLKKSINILFLMTYNFHYVSSWNSLKDNIIYAFNENDIKDRLPELGLQCKEINNPWETLHTFCFLDNEVIVFEIDGYLCDWHPAYLSYHVNHHIILINIDNNGTMEIIDPFMSNITKYINQNTLKNAQIKVTIYHKISFDVKSTRTFLDSHIESIKLKFIENLDLFNNNFIRIYNQLIKGIEDFNSIQFFRDVKSIVNSKISIINVLKEVDNTMENVEIATKLKNKWNIFMNRLVHVSISKQEQKDMIFSLLSDIIDKEKILINVI